MQASNCKPNRLRPRQAEGKLHWIYLQRLVTTVHTGIVQSSAASQHSWAVTASQSQPLLRSSSAQHDTSKPSRAHLIDVEVLHQPILQEVGEGPAAIAQSLHVLVAHAGVPLVTDDQGAAHPAVAMGALDWWLCCSKL